uniref:Uncharacterized protein n=1 Tax=Setaria italica TaxID=4555 RepID=K3ZYE9_SETIT
MMYFRSAAPLTRGLRLFCHLQARSHPSFSTHAQATGAMTSKVSGAQSEASSQASSGELSTSSSTLEAALLSFANQSSTPKSREMGFSLLLFLDLEL